MLGERVERSSAQHRSSSGAGQRLGDRVAVDVDPAYAGVAAEPALLADGELAGAHDDRWTASSSGTSTLEVVEELLVAEGLAGGARQSAGAGQQGRDLVEQARVASSVAHGARCARARPARGQRRPT